MASAVSVLQVDWVNAIKIGVLWDSKGIPSPHRPSGVECVQPESLGVFPETIYICFRRKICREPEVLVFENKGVSRSVEQTFAIGFSHDLERERGFLNVKTNMGSRGLCAAACWAGKNILRNLITFVIRIQDLDMDPGVWQDYVIGQLVPLNTIEPEGSLNLGTYRHRR